MVANMFDISRISDKCFWNFKYATYNEGFVVIYAMDNTVYPCS
jgi:hypothetical protein